MPMPRDVVDLLRSMVRINSVNTSLPGSDGGEAALLRMLAGLAERWGLATRWLPVAGQCDQLLVTAHVHDGLPWLLMDSHVDTVAVAGMTIDPLGGELRDGKVWGRGACDTKGTGAAMLWALYRYATRPAPSESRPHNVALLLSVDEEVTMSGARSFARHDLHALLVPAVFGGLPVACIVGEPTELRPIVAHNGCLRWTITTHGKACHSSVPHEGRSAISAMVRIIEVFERDYIPTLSASHPLTGQAACSINTIHGGSASNIIPDRCVIEIDHRIVPGEDPAGVVSRVRAMLEPLRQDDPPVQFDLEEDVAHPPLTDDRSGPLVAAVRGVLRDLGLPTLVLGAPFATNACYLDAAGIPTVVLGPGSAHTAHTKDEWVAVDQIERGAELYEAMMRCGSLAGPG